MKPLQPSASLIALDEPLDARRLRAFVMLAREGSFAAVAHDLGLTPSAMSHAIKTLEEDVGTQLLDRRGHKVVLNAAGERLLPHAERILRQMRLARTDLQALLRPSAGALRVGAPASVCQHLLPSALAVFNEAHPDCALNLMTQDTEASLEAMEGGRLDVALCIQSEGQGPAGLDWTPWFQDEMCLYVGKNHPWAGMDRLQPEDFANQSLIVYDRSTHTTRLIFSALKKWGASPAHVLTLGSMEAIKEMVKLNLGVGVVADWVAAQETESGDLVRVRAQGLRMHRDWAVVTARGATENPMVQKFIAELTPPKP
jgi:LysR family transcriptional regulator, low CO2-responsive transcriptional regulator